MPDQEPIPPPPPPSPGPELGPKSTSTGLPSNVAAAIACIPLWVASFFIFWKNTTALFGFTPCSQSYLVAHGFCLISPSSVVHVVFGAIPGIGGILVFFWAIIAALVQIAFLVVWIVATVKAFTNVRWEIPYIGPIARKQMEAAQA